MNCLFFLLLRLKTFEMTFSIKNAAELEQAGMPQLKQQIFIYD